MCHIIIKQDTLTGVLSFGGILMTAIFNSKLLASGIHVILSLYTLRSLLGLEVCET